MTRSFSRATVASLLALALPALLPGAASASPPEAPVTEAPSAITGTTATFHGMLNPGEATENVSYHFAYGGGSCGEGPVVPAGPPFPEVEGNHQEVSAPVTGLQAETQYTVCLVAANPANEAESTFGPEVHFSTPASAPVVLAQSTSGVTPYAATLQAEVNPENQPTTSCVFEYGKVVTENKLPCEQVEFSGFAPQTATRALAGLSPATVYHYRVIVKNATGETEGEEQEFETLSPQAPLIASESVSAIAPFQARLEGVLNPNFEATKCDFIYGLFENKVPCEPSLLEGFGEQGVGATIVNLTPSTTYHYHMLAKNATGETEGADQEFTTPALEAPTVASEAAGSITIVDAQLEARINPNDQETTYSFEYADEESVLEEGKGTVVPGAVPLPAVFEEVTAGPVDLGGALTPGTTYFYRVIATNETGETPGPIQQFTTSPPEPPIVGSESAGDVSDTGVTFEANINPVNQETTYSFEYATDEGFTENVESVPGEAALPAVNEELPTGPVAATGLEPETVYFYRVVASNPLMGTTDGPTQQFKTLAKPAVTTGEAQEPTRTTAIVSGAVNPGGASTTYRFVYVSEADFQPGAQECPEGVPCAYEKGASTASRNLFATGYSEEEVAPVTLEELAPGTTYHYALVATNSTGSTVGGDRTFTTAPPTPPLATTGAATAVSQLSATIAGSVDTRGLPSTIQFLIGNEPAGGSTIAATVTSQAGSTVQVAATLAGSLQPGTTYYYRVLATNADGTGEGAQATFTTAGIPAVFTFPAGFGALPFTPIASLNAKEAQENASGAGHHASRAELLAKALSACRHKHGRKRAACRRRAHQRYGPRKHK